MQCVVSIACALCTSLGLESRLGFGFGFGLGLGLGPGLGLRLGLGLGLGLTAICTSPIADGAPGGASGTLPHLG